MKKPKYINKLINEEIGMKNSSFIVNTHMHYSNLFSVPKIHLMIIGKISFILTALTLWNSIPKILRRIRSHHEFKKKLRFCC